MKNWFYVLRIAENCLLALKIVHFLFSACGLSTTPTLLACADATAHARACVGKGLRALAGKGRHVYLF